MPYAGMPPKPADERQRRNKPRWDTIPVEWDGVKRLPDLPEDIEWCERTKTWWSKWQTSPQSMIMVESDYDHMFDTALIHHRIYKNPIAISPNHLNALMQELRRRVASYGATWEDRMKLRMQITSPQDDREEEAFVRAEVDRGINYLDIVNQRVAEDSAADPD